MRWWLGTICLFFVVIMIEGCAGPQLKADRFIFEAKFPNRSFAADSSLSIHLEPFSCAKSISNPRIIGEAKVGFFNYPTPITSEVSVDIIMTEAIKKTFSRLGLTERGRDEAGFILSGQVERFWVHEAQEFSHEYSTASVRYDVMVRNRHGEFVWANSIQGMAISKKTMWDTTDEDIDTLLRALEKAVDALFADESFSQTLLKSNQPE